MKQWAWMAMAAILVSTGGEAQDFPSRQISVVVPYAAGGAMDAVGRIVAEQLQKRLGQPAIVDNRVGGNGIVGMRAVARAPADGHTLLISSEVGQAILPAIDKSFPLDSIETFTPVTLVGSFPHFLITRADLGVNSVAEFIAKARENPGKLNFGSNGVGTIAHVGMELLNRKAGIDIVHVPYRGSPAALFDLLGGKVDANIQSLPVVSAQSENKSLKILAVLSPERDPHFPDVPTMMESGYPDLVFVSWTAVFGPPQMPRAIARKIQETLSDSVKRPEIADRLRNLGFEPVGSTAADLDAYQRSIAAKWKDIAKLGIRLE